MENLKRTSSIHLSICEDKDGQDNVIDDDGRITPTPQNVISHFVQADLCDNVETFRTEVDHDNRSTSNMYNSVNSTCYKSQINDHALKEMSEDNKENDGHSHVNKVEKRNTNIFLAKESLSDESAGGLFENGAEYNVSRWVEFAKHIKPRNKKTKLEQTEISSEGNIDISDKYPTLQTSKFYQELYKRYPKAFQRQCSVVNHSVADHHGSSQSLNDSGSEGLTKRREKHCRSPIRRIFNSGLHVHFEDEAIDCIDGRSVCSELPLSARTYNEQDDHPWQSRRHLRHSKGHRACLTSPTPSLVSEASVKQRLDATSRKLKYLLYNTPPFHRNYHGYSEHDITSLCSPRDGHRGYSNYDLPNLISPRQYDFYCNSDYDLSNLTNSRQGLHGYSHPNISNSVTPRKNKVQGQSRRSWSRSSSTSTLVGHNDDNVQSTPRYYDVHCTSRHRLAREERILQLERELELKDIELQSFRKRLEIESNSQSILDNLNSNSLTNHGSENIENSDCVNQQKNFHSWHVAKSFSPPDSAIDVDNDAGSNLSSNDLQSDLHGCLNQFATLSSAHKNDDISQGDASYEQNQTLQVPEVTDVVTKEPVLVKYELTPDTNGQGGGSFVEQAESKRHPSKSDSDEDSGIVQNNQEDKGTDHGTGTHSQDSKERSHDQEELEQKYNFQQNQDLFLPSFQRSKLFTSTPNIHTIAEEEGSHLLDEDAAYHTSTLGRPRIRSHPDQVCHGKTAIEKLSLDFCTEQPFGKEAKYPKYRNKLKYLEDIGDDEVDDSDPRYGIPSVIENLKYDENLLRERYLKKRSTFNSNRQCLTAREKVRQNHLQKIKSTDPVSVLCSPRRGSEHKEHGNPPDYGHAVNFNINADAGADAVGESASNGSQNAKVDKDDSLRNIRHNQKMASELDMRKIGTTHNRLDFFPLLRASNKLSHSTESIPKGSSQVPLSLYAQDVSQSCMDLTDDLNLCPKVSGPIKVRRKFKLKKIFHFSKKGHYLPPEETDVLNPNLEYALKFKSMPILNSESKVLDIKDHGKHQTVANRNDTFVKQDNTLHDQMKNVPKAMSNFNSYKQQMAVVSHHKLRHSSDTSEDSRETTVSCNKAIGNGHKQIQSTEKLWENVENYNKMAEDGGSLGKGSERSFRTVSLSSNHSQNSKRSGCSSSIQFEEINDNSKGTSQNPPHDVVEDGDNINPYATARVVAQVKGNEKNFRSSEVDTEKTNLKAESQHIYVKVNVSKKKKVDQSKGTKLVKKFSKSTPDISMATNNVQSEPEGQPPLPDRKYNNIEYSNLMKTKAVSASSKSLNKNSKNPFKALKKAVSMGQGLSKPEIGHHPGSECHLKSHPVVEDQIQVKQKKEKSSKLKAFKNIFKKKSKKNEKKDSTGIKSSRDIELGPKDHLPTPYKKTTCQSLESLPSHHGNSGVSGKLTKLNVDGTQVIELRKPDDGPLGIFIARGNSHFKHGIFVSRFSGEILEKGYGGLVCVGDEIIEVNGFVVRDLALDDVYDIMAAKSCLTLRILPLLARQDS